MTTASEHSRTLLSAIIPHRRDLLDVALRHLTADHFPERTLGNLFVMLERYAEVTGAVLTRAALVDMLESARADAGKIALYSETYDLLHDTAVDEAAFRWALDQIRELAADRATNAALTEGMQILTRGLENERGELIRGHGAARAAVLSRFAEIDRDLALQDAPEGDAGSEGGDIIAEYTARESARLSGRSLGVEFGVPALDNRVGGLTNGDLALVLAFTSEGKTHLCVQLAWNAAVVQGLNVVFLTTETVRATVRRRLICRHSALEHFGIAGGGLNSRDLKNGTLTDIQRGQLADVVADWSRNPAYGRRWISQVPRGATIGYIQSKLTRIQRLFPIDLAIMDSLYLLRPDKRRNTTREELADMLKESKQLATGFNDGNGVPLLSPWQVSRAARLEAGRTGSYDNSSQSETAEAANSPDLVISLLAPDDNTQRVATLRGQLVKARDGERASPFDLRVDYATSRFSSDTRPPSGPDMLFMPA